MMDFLLIAILFCLMLLFTSVALAAGTAARKRDEAATKAFHESRKNKK